MAVKICTSCGLEVFGYSHLAGNVKCSECRSTPPYRQKTDTPKKGHVQCQICGVNRKYLWSHIEKTHKISREEYLRRYPGASLEAPRKKRSAECRKRQSQAAKDRWSSKEERMKQSKRMKKSAPWKGQKLSVKHREAISRGGLGVKHNLSSEDAKNRGIRGREVLSRIMHRPEVRQKLSKALKNRHRRGVVGFRDPEVWKKSYQTRLRNGTLNPPGAGRGIQGYRKGFSEYYFRSTFEVNFARILAHLGVNFEYEPKIFKLGTGRTYTPDFYLHSSLRKIPAGWVELKGWRDCNGNPPPGTLEKLNAFKELTGEPIFLLTMADPLWASLVSEFSTEIALWESPRKNLRSHPHLFGEVD